MNTKGGSRNSKSAQGGKGGPPAVIKLSQVQSILNEFTPQKFDKLVKLFNELVIDSEVKFIELIELIFEKVSYIDHDDLKSFMSLICQILLFLVHIFFLLWILDKSIILKSGKC